MRTILLKRVCFDDDGTYGVLIENNVPFMLMLEETWRDNARGISSIPTGTYMVKRIIRPDGREAWQVQNVPDRTAILIHSGNTEADTEGCLMPGLEWGVVKAKDDESGKIESQPAVLRSQEAFLRLWTRIEEDEFRLVITWC